MNQNFLRYIEKKTNVPHDENEYPFSVPIIKNMKRLDFVKPVTYLIGENGAGKSTIIEAIAASFGFNPEGGSKNFNFSTRSTHSCLHEHITLAKGVRMPKDGFFLRAESFYNLATSVEDLRVTDSYGDKSLHHQSHGESFISIAKNRFWGNGLYIFDEPEAALSVSSSLALLSIIHDLVKKESQFIIATHSPILLAYPNATIYEIDTDEIKEVDYTQTNNYLLTKYFINNHEKMLNDIGITD